MTAKNDEITLPVDDEIDREVDEKHTVAATAEEVVDGPAEDRQPPAKTGPVQRVLNGAARHWIALVLVVLLTISGGVTGWLYVNEYLPDQRTNAAAAESAIQAASDGTVALLSYSPESLDQDLNNAKSHLTGDFLSYYNDFTEQIVTPAATRKSVKTSASIVNSAVAELNPDSAVVMVFLNQMTTSAENPDGSFSTSSVKVGLTKVDGTWLISSFDPV